MLIIIFSYQWKFFKTNFNNTLRVFANGPGDLGSIPSRVIPKTLKMLLDTSSLTLSNIRYASTVKWSNPGKRINLGVVATEKGA